VVGESVRGELEERLVELGQFIQDQRRRTQLSVRRLAELSGISNALARAGITDAPPPPSGVVEAIRADLDLSEDQKSSLVQIYESFRLSGPTAAAPDAPRPAAKPAPKPTVTRNRRPANKVD
jgi:hypothetical protein